MELTGKDVGISFMLRISKGSKHVDVGLSDADLALDNKDLRLRIIVPALVALNKAHA